LAIPNFHSFNEEAISDSRIYAKASGFPFTDLVDGVFFGPACLDKIEKKLVALSLLLNLSLPAVPLWAFAEVRLCFVPRSFGSAQELFPLFFELLKRLGTLHCRNGFFGLFELDEWLIGMLHT
jgi:hypothetical protein